MEAVIPMAQAPREDYLSKPTIRIVIPLEEGKTTPTIVDIAEAMAKYREQLGESSEDEDYEDGADEDDREGDAEEDEEEESETDEAEEDSLDEEIEERELSPSEIEHLLPTEPKINRFSGVISRIERMYGGEYSQGRKQDDYDFDDSFIDDSDWKTYSDAPKTKHDGFFINKGTLELASDESESSSSAFQKPKKRKRSLDKADGKSHKGKESDAKSKGDKGQEKKERPKKKAKSGSSTSSPAKDGEAKKGSKVQPLNFKPTSPSSSTTTTSGSPFAVPKPKMSASSPTSFTPALEAALKAIELAAPSYPVIDSMKRMPKELDQHLTQVTIEARKMHPQGHIGAGVVQRLVKVLPFNERSIRHRMRRLTGNAAAAEEASLEEQIEDLMEELKEKVEQKRSANPTAKWKWSSDAGNLLCSIFELVDKRVEAYNKLHEKEPDRKLSDRKERKRIAEEIAKFWPDDQMKGADILRKNSTHKNAKKQKTKSADGDTAATADKEKKPAEKKDASSTQKAEAKKDKKLLKEIRSEKKNHKKDKSGASSSTTTTTTSGGSKEKSAKKPPTDNTKGTDKKTVEAQSVRLPSTATSATAQHSTTVSTVTTTLPTTTTPPVVAAQPNPFSTTHLQPTAPASTFAPGVPIARQSVPPLVPTRVTAAAEDDDVIVLS